MCMFFLTLNRMPFCLKLLRCNRPVSIERIRVECFYITLISWISTITFLNGRCQCPSGI